MFFYHMFKNHSTYFKSYSCTKCTDFKHLQGVSSINRGYTPTRFYRSS